jgi:GT2 family glycosyltransferase/glycosyltransferase involved in cell wall biosynthesis
MPKPACSEPVIYLHAKGRHQPGEAYIQQLLGLGLTVCCRLPLPGLTPTEHGYDQPTKLLGELSRRFPGSCVVILRAGLLPARQQIDDLVRILASEKQPAALTVLSNAAPASNPFAGLEGPDIDKDDELNGLIGLLAPGQVSEMGAWTDHFAVVSAPLLERLAQQPESTDILQAVADAGGALKIVDHQFLRDPQKRLVTALDLKPYEKPSPPPFAQLSSRIQAWFDAGIQDLPFTPGREATATLHITHSWGGGVAQWLRSFIDCDNQHAHFQLRSEGPQSGHGSGQRLSLYAGNELRCPVASWWLSPSIQSVDDEHEHYRSVLQQICQRYPIGRVFVSSLVGHSLDALRTGLPSLQILHDHFPAWPLLSVSPLPYLKDGKPPNLERALSEHKKNLEFNDKAASEWNRLTRAYLQTLQKEKVRIAAPGQSVLDIQNQLVPGFEALGTEIIPHGFPELEASRAVVPRPRSDGRLRMVILGRMQTGKGRDLLIRALPELRKHVQVYLLGTGKSGESLFGMSGVDIILDYDRQQLPELLAGIGPDFSALLSVVPETYSYTLSELQHMQVPVIATRSGSFPARIEHGKTGWLIDVEADALIRQVAELVKEPSRIESVRARLVDLRPPTLEHMLEAYNQLCPAADQGPAWLPAPRSLPDVQQAAGAFEHTLQSIELGHQQKRIDGLLKDLEQRTQWALHEQRQRIEWVGKLEANLREEQQRRAEWVASLEAEIERLQQMVAERQAGVQFAEGQLHLLRDDYQRLQQDLTAQVSRFQHLQAEYHQLNSSHQQLQARLRQTESDYRRLEESYKFASEQNAMLLNSLSWKITTPLRAVNQVIKTAARARVWNPARWPLLFSQLTRNLSTGGVNGTLKRLQNTAPDIKPEPVPAPKVATPVSDDSGDAVQAPAVFPQSDQPAASIVIPVYNKWAYTAACLCSLLEAKGEYAFEVIIVDDQSSDQTADQLAKIKGITYLRNEQNLGFVGSCNRGAQQARGEFLVFLNNDTQVTDHWLDELIDTFAREPEAGLVGSRLVYPDGKQQESGGIIFNDGSGWNYGRGQDAENPEYHFLREVDYCSGAAIALKTAFFRDIGAFDKRYSPAYYEDTDLAFRVRESGHKVFVQPASIVIHHEGVTSGTDTSSGTKQYQVINQEKFLERWKTALASQPAPVQDPNSRSQIFQASQHRVKKRILIIDATTPEPDKDSGSVRLTNLMQCCRELGLGVTFFADNKAYAGKYTRELQKNGIEVLYYPWLDSLADFFRRRGREFDYILISRHYVAINYVSLIRHYAPQAKFIFDTVDLHYLREQRLAELENSKTLRRVARQTKRSELVLVKAASATLVVSTVEQEVLAQDAPGHSVHILSNIHPVPGRGKDFSKRKDIYFVGGYQHPPNVDAALWFVRDIWPLIREQLPELQFHLIGSKAPDEIRELDGNGVVFHGFVESLDPFLDDCRMAVAPLRYGAGVKGKVNMSMAHGQPVVATPTAVEGMFAEHEKEVLVADDAESFAREVVRLYRDEALWNRISDASVRNVEEHFSMATARKHLQDLFASLAAE